MSGYNNVTLVGLRESELLVHEGPEQGENELQRSGAEVSIRAWIAMCGES